MKCSSQAATNIVLVSIVLLPLAMISPGPACHSHRVAFVFIAWLVALAWMIDNAWLQLLLTYLVCWQAYISLGWMFGWADLKWHVTSISATNRVMWWAIVFALVSGALRGSQGVFNAICVATIIQVVVAMFQIGGVNLTIDALSLIKENVDRGRVPEVYGTFGVQNALCTWLAVTLPFFFRRYWAAAIPYILFVLLWTAYAGREMVLFAGAVGVIVYTRKWWMSIALAGIVGFKMWSLGKFDILWAAQVLGGTRLDNWALVWSKITASATGFFLGQGTAAQVPMYPIHNEFLNIWYMWGLVGLVLVIGFLASLSWKNRIVSASCAALIVDALGFYSFRIPPVAYLGAVLFGIAGKEKR